MNSYIIFGWILFLVAILLILYYENKHLTVTSHDIISKKLPKDFHNSKIVLLTDLHNNSYGKNNSKLLKLVKEQKPDYILIAGDMIVGKEGYDTNVSLNFLKELAKEYTIYYGNGNHEQRLGIYDSTKDTVYREYIDECNRMGIHLLRNEHCFIEKGNSKIIIHGLEIHEDFYKKSKRPVMTKEYLNDLMGVPNKTEYHILIAHNPIYFKEYVTWGADLVVSGHVHGGMVRLPFLGGVISPQYQLFPKYDAGKFEMQDKYMVLSRGLGMHTIKIRFLNHPELVVINLKNE